MEKIITKKRRSRKPKVEIMTSEVIQEVKTQPDVSQGTKNEPQKAITVKVKKEMLPFSQFLALDAADTQAILAEMKGEIISSYVYQAFDKSGKLKLEGLTKAGVEAVCNELSETKGVCFRVLDKDIKLEEGKYGDTYNVIVTVGKFVVTKDGKEYMLNSTYGASSEPKFKFGANGRYANPFAYIMALTKAERNAKRKLIPEKIAIEMIKAYKKLGKVQPIKTEITEGEEVAYEESPQGSQPNQIPQDFAAKMKITAIAKQQLGADNYYRILGGFGYEHSNELLRDDPKKFELFLEACREEYKMKKGESHD